MRLAVRGRGVRVSAALPPLLALLVSCGTSRHNAADGGLPRDTAPGAPLTVTTDNLPAGMVDVKYHASLSATGGLRPLTWRVSVGSLPPGLSLNPATGSIDGTPAQEGQFPITIEAADSGTPPQVDTETLTVRVQPRPGPVSIATTSLPDGQVGVAYTVTLQGAGGALPYAWVIDSGALPDGIRLNFVKNGNEYVWTIAGTPTTAGTWSFVVRINDSLTPSQTATQPLSILVAPPPPIVIQTTSLPAGVVGHGYSAPLAATGGLLPYAWQVVVGTLPNGLSLPANASDGGVHAISGTPTTVGSSTFTVRVYDSYHPTGHADQQLTIVVTNPPQEDAGVQDDAAQQDAAQDVQTDVNQTDMNHDVQTDVNQSDVNQDDVNQTDVNQDDVLQQD